MATRLVWLHREASGYRDRSLANALEGFALRDASTPADLSRQLATESCDAVLATGGWDVNSLVNVQETLAPQRIPLIVVLHQEFQPGEPHGSPGQLEQAVALAQADICHVLAEDSSPEMVLRELDEAARSATLLRAARDAAAGSPQHWRDSLVGASRSMFAVMKVVELVSQRRCTVLITGETGTGKEMVARAIHAAGPRIQKPLVPVNCTALPDTLLEAELFGHTKGAFTGAVGSRVGRFEEAQGGTIFLDEIGDMPIDLQAKLLRVLQEREIQRIGSSDTISIDVRVIAATNVDLQQRVAEGKFREDLFYRLNVVPIHLPPLRERTSDIPLLTQTFVEKICSLEHIETKKILQETMHHLCTYDWPGNVRQLENSVEMAVVLSGDRRVLVPGDFRLPKRSGTTTAASATPEDLHLPEDGLDFEATVSALERALLQQALQRARGNKRMAAELLRLKRTTLTAKLKSLSLAS